LTWFPASVRRGSRVFGSPREYRVKTTDLVGVTGFPRRDDSEEVTQEMDQVYGGFKTDYRRRLADLVAQKMTLWTPTSTTKSFSGQVKLSATHFGKIIFGTHANNNEQLVLPTFGVSILGRETY
jgi:hypothetical protein